jgi:hypothetical protein
MTTDEVTRLYNAQELHHIDDDCIIININGQYNRAMGTEGIYKATKEIWRIAKWRLNKIKYVLSEYRGLIVEVFAVQEWYQKERGYGINSKKAGQTYKGYGFEKAATTTGINSHVFDIWKKEKIYTIDGKKVSEAKHGLFIVNGKKVLVK